MVLVVLFTIIIIGGIASQSGFLGEFGKQMDKLFGKKTNTMAYYETSKASVDALTCAINTVSTNEDQCSGLETKYSKTATATATSSEQPNGINSGTASQNYSIGETSVECNGIETTTTRCTVKNFKLPQDISKKEDWIPYYGDLAFITYWNQFPSDEDTWTLQSNWKVHLMFALVSLIPPTKIAGFVVRDAAMLIKPSEEFVVQMLSKKAGIELSKEAAKEEIEKMGEEGVKKLVKNAIKYEGRTQILTNI